MFEILNEANCRCVVVYSPNDPLFYLTSKTFSTTLHIRLGLPHPLALGLSHHICDQPLDPMQMHLFYCAHGGERMISYDVVHDAFISIVKDA